ncbi:hypothetical protein [Alkalihalobacillus sp. 1P02AB]|uniref:hypothetical protein n=1 Tax=Alkalihalobacillus sp. 1P02AB TaxID=3132260 RepID=UPI0039A58562
MKKIIDLNKVKEVKSMRLETKSKHFPEQSKDDAMLDMVKESVKWTEKSVELTEKISSDYIKLGEQYKSDMEMLKSRFEVLLDSIDRMENDYSIVADFIWGREDLHDDFVSYLKDLKRSPEGEYQKGNIETLLSEYGADEETEKWLAEEMRTMNGGM